MYRPTGDFAWAKQYAHLPTPVLIDSNRIRVYYAGLNQAKHGSVGYVDVDTGDPRRVIHVAPEPILHPGEPGLFDDCGVNPSSMVRVGDTWRLYYVGWQRSQGVSYVLFSGLEQSTTGESFEKLSQVPILDRTHSEPYLRSAPFVLSVPSGFRVWYVSATGWTKVNDQAYPKYVVRTAHSADGVSWSSAGPICIDLAGDEFGIGRPWVIRDPDCYRMWYSIRSHSRPYRIGYAESADGIAWTRLDGQVGITASGLGWDSEMICYGAVIDVNGQRLMFYNGNRHGESGFGVAVLEQD